MRSEIVLGFFFEKFFSRILLVEDAIRLLAQSGTTDDVGTSMTIERKRSVDAIITLGRKECAITALDNRIAETLFPVERPVRVIDLLAMQAVFGETAIFVIVSAESQIAALVIRFHIRILALDHIIAQYRDMRHGKEQVSELLEKRFREVIFLSMIKCIPPVAPPAIPAIHLCRIVGRESRHDRSAAFVAIALVDRLRIARRQALDIPAFRTPCRRRHADLFIKRKIIRFYSEIILAALASLGFHTSNILFLEIYATSC